MDSTNIVSSKENIQPLRHGRVASMLCTGLQAQTDSDAERLLLQKRQEFETLLRDDTLEDKMTVWYDYINWLEQSFPSQSQKKNVNVVIVKCIKKFMSCERYKNDERFVKICLKYATLAKDSLDTLGVLYSGGIGTHCAILYITWAEIFSLAGNFKKAEMVYQKGLENRAEPLQLLKDSHRNFQAFLVRKVLNDEKFVPTSEVLAATRKAYNKLCPETNSIMRVGENVDAPGKVPLGKIISNSKNNCGIKIYQDDGQEVLDDPRATGAKHKFKSHAARTKENQKKAGPWTNKESKNVPFTAPSTISSFPVHEDEDQVQVKGTPSVMSSVLKPKQVEDEFNVDFAKVPLCCPEVNDPTKKVMYCKDQIYAGGMEFQFEELKAMKYLRQMAKREQSLSEEVPYSITKLYSSGTKAVPESGRSSLKIRPTEEARIVRRKIALESAEASHRAVNSARKCNTAKTVARPLNFDEKDSNVVSGDFYVDFNKMPIFINEPYDPTKRAMYPKEKIYAGGIELQLEELKAKKYLTKRFEEEKSVAVVLKRESPVPSTASVSKQSTLKKSYEPKERRFTSTARKSMASNFAGVVRLGDGCSSNLRPGISSESFVNQTINTKEVLNEMEELWFAKPASPFEQPKNNFDIFVDESCFNGESPDVAPTPHIPGPLSTIPMDGEKAETQYTKSTTVKPFLVYDDSVKNKENGVHSRGIHFSFPKESEVPCVTSAVHVSEDSEDKENFIPENYVGPLGKSVRPVTGILTLAENVPFEPICENYEEDEDAEQVDDREAPGNVTETWNFTQNFTQAFQYQKIAYKSTPNTLTAKNGLSIQRAAVNESIFVSSEEEEMGVQPLNLAVAQPIASNDGLTVPREINKNKQYQSGPSDVRFATEHSNKNLSVIVESSREYKSSSSGGGSTCSKVFPATPGESHLEGYSKKFSSLLTPSASKTVSSCGYETSTECLPCPEFERLQSVPEQDEACIDKDCQSIQTSMHQLNLETASVDIDPFCNQVTDKLLETIQFPTANHQAGCFFLYNKLQPIKLHSTISVADRKIEVTKLLGEGAYAKVFEVHMGNSGNKKVIKYQKPALPWEFYIAREIRARCSKDKVCLFMHIEEAFFYENASLFLSEHIQYGSLLNAINSYKAKQGKLMGDYLALYFTVQILEIIEALHSIKIIHGDIKPDNFLVRKQNGRLQLVLIDFGRSIDMSLFPEKTTFTRVISTDGFACIEMQTQRPWTYQLDLYGVAACVHCLIFNEYMKVTQKAGVWTVVKAIPRYLAKSGWKNLFETLLNVKSCEEMPNITSLRSDMLLKLEAYGQNADLIKLTNFLQNA